MVIALMGLFFGGDDCRARDAAQIERLFPYRRQFLEAGPSCILPLMNGVLRACLKRAIP